MKRVLIVDDSPLSRSVVRSSLSMAMSDSVDVTEAGDGAAALRALKFGAFDLIFADLNMPNLDGTSLVVETRKLPRHVKTPIVIVSSLINPAKEAELRRLGANAVLKKPFQVSGLKQALVEVAR